MQRCLAYLGIKADLLLRLDIIATGLSTKTTLQNLQARRAALAAVQVRIPSSVHWQRDRPTPSHSCRLMHVQPRHIIYNMFVGAVAACYRPSRSKRVQLLSDNNCQAPRKGAAGAGQLPQYHADMLEGPVGHCCRAAVFVTARKRGFIKFDDPSVQVNP
jgi:hypothetical protein